MLEHCVQQAPGGYGPSLFEDIPQVEGALFPAHRSLGCRSTVPVMLLLLLRRDLARITSGERQRVGIPF